MLFTTALVPPGTRLVSVSGMPNVGDVAYEPLLVGPRSFLLASRNAREAVRRTQDGQAAAPRRGEEK